MRTEEHDQQVALFNWINVMSKKYPFLNNAFAIPNGGHRHISVAKKLKAEGVKRGVPDIFIANYFYISDIMCCGLFIEMKSKKGIISKEQKEWINRLGMTGFKVEVCHSWTEAANKIIDYYGMKEKYL